MDLYDQIRTPEGRYPTRDARLEEDGTVIAFDFRSPQEVAKSAAASGTSGTSGKASESLPELSIEDLAVIPRIEMSEEVPASSMITEDRLIDLARRSGPLFKKAEPELVSDWKSALVMACEIVSMQEVLNGQKTLGASKMTVDKSRVLSKATGSEFSIYVTSFDLGLEGGSAYTSSMPTFPWFKRFSQDGSFDYSFMQTSEEGGHVILTAFLLSFKHEISLVDFAALIAYFYEDPTIVENVVRSVTDEQRDMLADADDEREIETALGIASREDNLIMEGVELSEGDYPHLQKLVHALISLHLQGIRVDAFASTERNDFMVFDTYLSHLWYVFANKLGQVRIGYCERCGNGFSLTGSRGITKRFCSPECKTAAKNERMRTRNADERERFWNGERVHDIADSAAHKRQSTKKALESVRTNLRTWKQLQHALDAALATGPAAASFVQRCADDGVFSEEYVRERAQRISNESRIRKAARANAENPNFREAITRKSME